MLTKKKKRLVYSIALKLRTSIQKIFNVLKILLVKGVCSMHNNKWLISRILFLSLWVKKEKDSLIRHFKNKGHSNRPLKRGSISLVIRDLQIKITRKYRAHPPGWQKLLKSDNIKYLQGYGIRKTFIRGWYNYFENSLAWCGIAEHSHTLQPSTSIFRFKWWEISCTCAPVDILKSISNSIVFNR